MLFFKLAQRDCEKRLRRDFIAFFDINTSRILSLFFILPPAFDNRSRTSQSGSYSLAQRHFQGRKEETIPLCQSIRLLQLSAATATSTSTSTSLCVSVNQVVTAQRCAGGKAPLPSLLCVSQSGCYSLALPRAADEGPADHRLVSVNQVVTA